MDPDRLLPLSAPCACPSSDTHQVHLRPFLYDVPKQRLTILLIGLSVWRQKEKAEIRVVGEGIVMSCGGLSVQSLPDLSDTFQAFLRAPPTAVPPSSHPPLSNPTYHPSFSVWLKHSCNPVTSPSYSNPPSAFSKDAKENKDKG